MIDQLEKEIHEGMLDLYQHQSMSRERESLVYFYFAGIHNENITLKEEIKRLKEEYVILQNASDEVEEEKDKEIERLNSIIKEVREYIERYLRLNLEAFNTKDLLEKILEILDKENNNEDN